VPQHFKGPALAFWPFHVCRNYILTAKDGNSRMMDFFPRFLDINEELEKSVGEIKLVFGHNDLLVANFIDDGKRLWLLDWDYAGYNTALFDLANQLSQIEVGIRSRIPVGVARIRTGFSGGTVTVLLQSAAKRQIKRRQVGAT
jgi:hypothetical protein